MTSVDESIAAVVLAAGRSSRMGHPKAALMMPNGNTFLGQVVDGLLDGGVARVVVVTSSTGDSVRAALPARQRGSVEFSVNENADRGQLSSLQCGLAAVAGAGAVVVALVDVPLVSPAVVASLLSAWTESHAALVRPMREGRHGHPMLIAEPLITHLLAADPELSAREIVREYAASGIEIPTTDEGPFLDVDTPEDYRRLFARV